MTYILNASLIVTCVDSLNSDKRVPSAVVRWTASTPISWI